MAVTPLTAREQYGGDRILADPARMYLFDPGWSREDAIPPAGLAKLNTAEADAGVLGQRFTWPGGSILYLGLRPHEIGLCVLRLPDAVAAGYRFTGADADRLTFGWRRLVAGRRARVQLCGPQAPDEKKPACLRY